MPKTEVSYYTDDRATSPVKEWIETLKSKMQGKAVARVAMLADFGHELRRPIAMDSGMVSENCAGGIRRRIIAFSMVFTVK